MAEYEMSAFRDDKAAPVETIRSGERPSEESIHKMAEKANLGGYNFRYWRTELRVEGHVQLDFDNGHIDIRKETN